MLSFIRITKSPYRWLINQAHRKMFETHFIGKENVVYDAISKNVLKDNNARTIFTIETPELNILVKRYKIRGLLGIIKATFLAPARKEVRASDYLINHHINTIYPLGVLEKKKLGFTTDIFLFVRKMENAISIKDFIVSLIAENRNKTLGESRDNIKSKNDILKSLAELVREVHRATFFHQDFHLGNILIDPKSPVLYLIDLHRSSILSYFTQPHKISNLAQIIYSLSTVLSSTDIYRFIKYYHKLDFRTDVLRDFITTVLDKVKILQHKHWRNRNKRCLRNSSHYAVMNYRNYRISLKRQDDVSGIIKLIANHDKIVVNEPHKLFKYIPKRLISRIAYNEIKDKVKKNDSSTSALTSSLNLNVFIKEYRYSFGNRVWSLFGNHPAKKSWFSANGLLIRHTLTAEPIALVEETDPFYTWVKRSYVITREIEAEPTNQFVVGNFVNRIKDKKTLERKIGFIKEFAFAVRRLHQNGIFHYDLKSNNILIKENTRTQTDNYSKNLPDWSTGQAGWTFYFIDLDRMKFSYEVSLPELLKNLSQLNASVSEVMTKADRLRFYRFYSEGEKELPHNDEKAIIKQIMALTIKRHHFWPQQY
ncbi:MAG: lipopolysaccharide kinase InaA family protein [Planctomycetota bacterium]